MKNLLITIWLCLVCISLQGQEFKPVVLDSVDFSQGSSLMAAMKRRASATGFDSSAITPQQLSALLWCANGINRPSSGKRTAASAINAQDIDVYVCTRMGIWMYNPQKHQLDTVAAGDFREWVAGRQTWVLNAPVFLILVSDLSRFSQGNDSTRLTWADMDAGIVAQNISLYCASVGLETRIRAVMEYEKLRVAMKLKPSQCLILNTPVGYQKKQ
jgi:SagB-type dehydrogenase family enzyme